MSAGSARGSRRRRVLSDELRQASHLGIAAYDQAEAGKAPRYGEAALPENHLAVSDLAPRRKRTILFGLTAVAAATCGAELLYQYAGAIAASAPGVTAKTITTCAAGIFRWSGIACLVGVGVAARFIFSLRRHRVDDHKGRYRVWRSVGIASVFASVVIATRGHLVIAKILSAATGWAPLAGGCGWWLAPVGVFCLWRAIRLLGELGESRGSATLVVAATACYTAGGIAIAGGFPAEWARWSATAARVCPLAGHAFLAAAAAVFARYVLLDVEGLIARKPKRSSRRNKKSAAEEAETPAAKTATKLAGKEAPAESDDEKPATVALKASTASPPPAPKLQWEDDESEDDENDGRSTRKLSKADKKRLRQQQRDERRAA